MTSERGGRTNKFGCGLKGKPHAPGVRLGNAPTRDGCQGDACAKGGAVKDKWIQKAVPQSHKGRLHKALGVAAGKKIPAKKLSKALHSDNPHMRHMAQFAKNVKK